MISWSRFLWVWIERSQYIPIAIWNRRSLFQMPVWKGPMRSNSFWGIFCLTLYPTHLASTPKRPCKCNFAVFVSFRWFWKQDVHSSLRQRGTWLRQNLLFKPLFFFLAQNGWLIWETPTSLIGNRGCDFKRAALFKSTASFIGQNSQRHTQKHLTERKRW